MLRVDLLDYTRDGEKLIASIVKRFISQQTTSKISDEEIEKLIIESIKHGYWSLWKFSNYVFDIECSYTCKQYISKYSYVQTNQKYDSYLNELFNEINNRIGRPCTSSDYSCHIINLMEFEKKLNEARNQVEEDTLFSVIEKYFYVPNAIKQNREIYKEYIAHILASIKMYLIMMIIGISHEYARYVFPQSFNSRFIVQMNAMELATSFLSTGTCSQSQKEIRCVAWKMLMKLESIHPRIFGYIGPKCILMENMIRDQPIKIRDVINPDINIEFMINKCPEGVPRESIRTCVINSYKSALDL